MEVSVGASMRGGTPKALSNLEGGAKKCASCSVETILCMTVNP
jgi:hypothetical protein